LPVGLPAEEALPWNAPAPSGDRRRLPLGPGFCHDFVILDFCLAREGDPSPLFRFEKSPRGHFTALFDRFVAFFIIFYCGVPWAS